MPTKATVLFVLTVSLSFQTAWALDECGKAGPREACQITIDRLAPISGKTVKVENETAVTVTLINKSPFESCKNEVKREELPDVSPIPTLLETVATLAKILVLTDNVANPASNTPANISMLLGATATCAEEQRKTADDLQKRYTEETGNLKKFFGTRYARGTEPGEWSEKEIEFEADRAGREVAVDALVNQTAGSRTPELFPTTAGCEATYSEAMTAYSAYIRSPAADPKEIQRLLGHINRARSMLDALAKAVTALDAARTVLRSTLNYLVRLEEPEWEVLLPLHGDRNAKLAGQISCTSDVTGKPTVDLPVAYKVIFRNTPRLSLTAGVVVSTLPRNEVGLEQVEDSRTGDTVTMHTEIRDHPTRPQVVPCTFLNVRVGPPWRWRGHVMTINLTPGLGVNPNNGGGLAEFFLGSSLGFGDFFLSAGAHIGHEVRPANGFELNDRPPAGLSEVPVETPWKAGFGFAVSYRIPLK